LPSKELDRKIVAGTGKLGLMEGGRKRKTILYILEPLGGV